MKTEKEKMLAGENYSALDRTLTEERLRAKMLLKKINVELYITGKDLSLTIKELMPKAASDIYIEPPFHCDYGYNILTGKRVYINVNCVFLDVCEIRIGSGVLFGPGVQVYTATHPLNSENRKKEMSGRAVTIGDNCWIGGGAIILPGINIGNNSVVAAGSVVTRDVPESTLVAGNPAKIVKQIK